jgi:hypothetical protein
MKAFAATAIAVLLALAGCSSQNGAFDESQPTESINPAEPPSPMSSPSPSPTPVPVEELITLDVLAFEWCSAVFPLVKPLRQDLPAVTHDDDLLETLNTASEDLMHISDELGENYFTEAMNAHRMGKAVAHLARAIDSIDESNYNGISRILRDQNRALREMDQLATALKRSFGVC